MQTYASTSVDPLPSRKTSTSSVVLTLLLFFQISRRSISEVTKKICLFSAMFSSSSESLSIPSEGGQRKAHLYSSMSSFSSQSIGTESLHPLGECGAGSRPWCFEMRTTDAKPCPSLQTPLSSNQDISHRHFRKENVIPADLLLYKTTNFQSYKRALKSSRRQNAAAQSLWARTTTFVFQKYLLCQRHASCSPVS